MTPSASISVLADYRTELAQLPPEPWGARMARARESRGLTSVTAAGR